MLTVRRVSVLLVILMLVGVIFVSQQSSLKDIKASLAALRVRMTQAVINRTVPATASIKPTQKPHLTPEGAIVHIQAVDEKTDLCKTWSGRPQEAKEWWHWTCLISRYVATLDYTCKKPVPAGNWWMCADPPWKPAKPCLVYSFGIANDWRFDDFMSQKMNCTVHSFDPSMKKPHFMRNPRNLFYYWGLGGTDTKNHTARINSYVRSPQTWQMLSLKSIKEYLGHQNSVLDYLKIDIELSEWPVLENFLENPDLLSKVRQLAIEWHIFPKAPKEENFEKMYRSLMKLRDLGFYAYRTAPVAQWKDKIRSHYNLQSEMSYINSRFAAG